MLERIYVNNYLLAPLLTTQVFQLCTKLTVAADLEREDIAFLLFELLELAAHFVHCGLDLSDSRSD